MERLMRIRDLLVAAKKVAKEEPVDEEIVEALAKTLDLVRERLRT